MKQLLFLGAILFSSLFTLATANRNVTIPAPQNVKASDGQFSGKINIEWDRVAHQEEVKYQVYRGSSPTVEDMKMLRAPMTSDNKFSDRYQLVAGETYYYRVRAAAVNSRNSSLYSEADSGFVMVVATPQDSLQISNGGEE